MSYVPFGIALGPISHASSPPLQDRFCSTFSSTATSFFTVRFHGQPCPVCKGTAIQQLQFFGNDEVDFIPQLRFVRPLGFCVLWLPIPSNAEPRIIMIPSKLSFHISAHFTVYKLDIKLLKHRPTYRTAPYVLIKIALEQIQLSFPCFKSISPTLAQNASFDSTFHPQVAGAASDCIGCLSQPMQIRNHPIRSSAIAWKARTNTLPTSFNRVCMNRWIMEEYHAHLHLILACNQPLMHCWWPDSRAPRWSKSVCPLLFVLSYKTFYNLGR